MSVTVEELEVYRACCFNEIANKQFFYMESDICRGLKLYMKTPMCRRADKSGDTSIFNAVCVNPESFDSGLAFFTNSDLVFPVQDVKIQTTRLRRMEDD